MSSTRKLLEQAPPTKLAGREQTAKDHPASLNYYQDGDFYRVPIDEIQPNPNQPRQHFDQESLNELAQSIKEKGVLQPVLVRVDQARRIYLVAGERRLRAAKLAGLTEIPAIITTGNPAEISLIENLQRENLRPIEEAEAFDRMIKEYQYTQEQLANVIGKSRVIVTETLSLNKLPEEIKEECRRVDIYPKRVLIQVARRRDQKAMLSFFQKIKQADQASGDGKERINKRTVRTPAAIATERATLFQGSLNKLNLDTIEDIERDTLINVLETLKDAIDEKLRQLIS